MNKTKAHLNEEGRLHVAPRSKKYNDVIKPVFLAFNKIESKKTCRKDKGNSGRTGKTKK